MYSISSSSLTHAELVEHLPWVHNPAWAGSLTGPTRASPGQRIQDEAVGALLPSPSIVDRVRSGDELAKLLVQLADGMDGVGAESVARSVRP